MNELSPFQKAKAWDMLKEGANHWPDPSTYYEMVRIEQEVSR